MINPIYEKLAKIVVEYSLEVKKGHKVYIGGPAFATELFQALHMEIIKAGAHVLIVPNIDGNRCEAGQDVAFIYRSEIGFDAPVTDRRPGSAAGG